MIYEKLDSYEFDTAENKEKFVVWSKIWTCIFGFLTPPLYQISYHAR